MSAHGEWMGETYFSDTIGVESLLSKGRESGLDGCRGSTGGHRRNAVQGRKKTHAGEEKCFEKKRKAKE